MDGNANAVSSLHIFTVNVEQEISLNFHRKLAKLASLLKKLVKCKFARSPCDVILQTPGKMKFKLNLKPNSSVLRLKN